MRKDNCDKKCATSNVEHYYILLLIDKVINYNFEKFARVDNES